MKPDVDFRFGGVKARSARLAEEREYEIAFFEERRKAKRRNPKKNLAKHGEGSAAENEPEWNPESERVSVDEDLIDIAAVSLEDKSVEEQLTEQREHRMLAKRVSENIKKNVRKF